MPLLTRISGTFCTTEPNPPSASVHPPKIDWSRLTNYEIAQYSALTSRLCMDLQAHALCQEWNCRSSTHCREIDEFCAKLTAGLLESATTCSPSSTKRFKSYLIPGWNAQVKDLHAKARASFLAWRAASSPKDGSVLRDMIHNRREFKSALKICKRDSEAHRLDGLANAISSSSPTVFWREVKKSSTNLSRASTIDGISDEKSIGNLWGKRFSAMFNAQDDTTSAMESPATPNDIFYFTPDLCKSACLQLNTSATPGPDRLSAHHFRHCSADVFPTLATFFNSVLTHRHLPGIVSDTVVSPIPKGNLPDLTSSDSYRGIASASTLSKILEASIASAFHKQLSTCNLQFGFKAGHDTESAVFLLKEVVHSYTDQGSPVYACFLDLKMAFDSVDHSILLQRLQNVGLPGCVTALLSSWFKTQRMCAKWGSQYSDWFSVR